jgi:LacI family transcriptional regulator
MVTLNDVARLASVSKSTVSNVIRGSEVVAPATRARVEAAIRELNYQPNVVARALRERTSKILGLLVPEAVNPFFAQVAHGVEGRARLAGYGVLIANTDCDPAIEAAQVAALVSRRADGVIIGGLSEGSSLHETLLERGVPVVCAYAAPPDPRLGIVDSDDVRAMRLVVEHLYDLGHRRLGFARHTLAEAGGERRLHAFLDAARNRDGVVVVPLDEGPTAIVAHNDDIAIAQIDALERAGQRVPEDVSVVGFDDIPLAAHHRIELTTVRSDGTRAGERAADLVLEAIRDGRHVAQTDIIPAHLIVRASTGPVNGRG